MTIIHGDKRVADIPLALLTDKGLYERLGDPTVADIHPDMLSMEGSRRRFHPTIGEIDSATADNAMIFVGGKLGAIRAMTACELCWGQDDDLGKDRHLFRHVETVTGVGEDEQSLNQNFSEDLTIVQELMQNEYSGATILVESTVQDHPRTNRFKHLYNTFLSYQAEMRVRPGKKVINDLKNSVHVSSSIDPRFLPAWKNSTKAMIFGSSSWLDGFLCLVRDNAKLRAHMKTCIVLVADSAIPAFKKYGIHYDGWGAVDPAGAKTPMSVGAKGILFTESTADPGTLMNAKHRCMALATAGINKFLPKGGMVYPVHQAPIDNVSQHLYWTVRRWWGKAIEIMVVGCDLVYRDDADEDSHHCKTFKINKKEIGVDFDQREMCRDGVERRSTLGMQGARENWVQLVANDPNVWNASKYGLEWGKYGDPVDFLLDPARHLEGDVEKLPHLGVGPDYQEYLNQIGFLGHVANEAPWADLGKAFDDIPDARYSVRMMDEKPWIEAKNKWRYAIRHDNPKGNMEAATKSYQITVRRLIKAAAVKLKQLVDDMLAKEALRGTATT